MTLLQERVVTRGSGDTATRGSGDTATWRVSGVAMHTCRSSYHEVALEVPQVGVDHLRSPCQTPVLGGALEYVPAGEDGEENIGDPKR